MVIPAHVLDVEAGNSFKETEYQCRQYSSQPMLNFEKYDNQSALRQESNQMETNLFALTSKLSCLDKKAQQLGQFFFSHSLCSSGHKEQQQEARSTLNSVLHEVIITSGLILSQCQILSIPEKPPKEEGEERVEIIEMKEDDILAEHAHFCKICGKGFRRDGNVRIHMRSHGNQYKTQEALRSSKPKPISGSYYSCPFGDCRRNRGHPSFKPLKSLVCLRNHYRRSHCTKMYACNKCGKDFSFVGDLKTHGNKCGHATWRCSCNSTFSTKNKLFRHVTLFQEGHKPVLASHTSSSAPPPPPLKVVKPTSNEKRLDYCAKDGDDLAAEVPPYLAEGPPSYGNAEDLLRLDIGSVGIQESEYMSQDNEFAFFNDGREENELYGSLFW
ncbi:hypothetical protein SUGI_0235930 [Cryptomeria japonica]|uniref:zinc finger protein STOP1 homolog n=1 Tax=Cryptomeria japonica TaxID=3369 RepID=UPI002408BB38|nr:zinc finger protein STOP1 homolog [Cryptomeria japonica]GLJ14574.1 hypothetical protein SUGI_0235930 [Cryptomeria japonica]